MHTTVKRPLFRAWTTQDITASLVPPRSDVTEWCAWAEAQERHRKPYASATLNSWWRVLKQMLQDMAADVGVPDPTLRVRPPSSRRRDVREQRTLTARQVSQLLKAIAAKWPAMHVECSVLAYTGIRDGELRGLNCGDYQTRNGVQVLVVERSVLKDGSVGPTKTGEPRVVPVTPALANLLEEHLATLRQRGYLAVGDMPLFPGRGSARRSEGAHYATITKASAEIGLGWHAGPQTLRRTLNSRLRDNAPGELVRAVLGHTTEDMTNHYYGADLAQAQAAVLKAMCDTSGVTPSETPGAGTPGVPEKL